MNARTLMSIYLATGGIGLLVGGGAAVARKVTYEKRVNEILDLIDERVKSRSGDAAATSEDIPAKLKQLAELRDQGVITPEEFDTKKAELLARM